MTRHPTHEMLDMLDEADEITRVLAWREQQALHLGLAPQEAEVFAIAGGDLHELERLIRQGCDPTVAFEIVS